MDKDKDKVEGYHFIWGIVVGAVGLAVVYMLAIYDHSFWSWEYWGCCKDETSSKAEIVRNWGLLLVAVFGFAVAIWRGIINTMQENTARRKLGLEEWISFREDVEQENRDFINALRMFGDKESQSLRYAGVLALSDKAKADPDKYYLKVYTILRSFVEEVPRDGGEGISRSNYESLTVNILKSIGQIRLRRDVRDIEAHESFDTSFRNISVCGKWYPNWKVWETTLIENGNFSGIHFHGANMQGIKFDNCYIKRMYVSPPAEIKEMKRGLDPDFDYEIKNEELAFRPSIYECFSTRPKEVDIYSLEISVDQKKIMSRSKALFRLDTGYLEVYSEEVVGIWLSKDLILPIPVSARSFEVEVGMGTNPWPI